MKTKIVETYEANIYIGSREQYNGPKFGLQELRYAIRDKQEELGIDMANPVRITEVGYLFQKYWETGWQISIINYARSPRQNEELDTFAIELGKHLFEKFNQNRLSVVIPSRTIMFEQDNPELTHEQK